MKIQTDRDRDLVLTVNGSGLLEILDAAGITTDFSQEIFVRTSTIGLIESFYRGVSATLPAVKLEQAQTLLERLLECTDALTERELGFLVKLLGAPRMEMGRSTFIQALNFRSGFNTPEGTFDAFLSRLNRASSPVFVVDRVKEYKLYKVVFNPELLA